MSTRRTSSGSALRERHEESWRILEDDSLLPGGCRIETEHSRIDATIETRLAQAVKQLFEQQREQATHPLASDIRIDLDAPETSMRLERTSFARRLEGYTEAVRCRRSRWSRAACCAWSA